MVSTVVSAITDKDLQAGARGLVEVGLDSLLDPGVIRSIPVLGTIHSVWKAGQNIRDRAFEAKLVRFLQVLQDVPAEDRRAMVDQLDTEPGYQHKVGERLILLLERLDTIEKADLVGYAFKAYCAGAFGADMLSRLNRTIDRLDPALFHKVREYRDTERTDARTMHAFFDAGLSYLPPGMATVYYRADKDLCTALLEYVLVPARVD